MTGDRGRGGLGDGVRLAVGTLTALPVRPPRRVDRRSASWAMTVAPLAGLLLAVPSGLLLLALRTASPLVASAAVLALLALLTRGLHLDGLADTADGLGSGRPAEEALAVMRRGDIGPFGVTSLVLVLLLQAAALAELVAGGRGFLGITVALVVSRCVLPLACSAGIPAARADGLGRVVAGTVAKRQLLASAVLAGAALFAVSLASAGGFPSGTGPLRLGVAAGAACLLPLCAGAALCRWCVRRLGGVTGDVLGACVEVTFTAALVVLCLL